MPSNKDYLEMIEDLFDRGDLTKWEDSFLVSISDQLEHGRPLTERQEEILQTMVDSKL